MAYSTISMIGIIGNMAVIIVVTKSPQMRTLTNKLIGNLAIADLLVNVVCVPSTLVANLYPGNKIKYHILHLSLHSDSTGKLSLP